MGQKKEGTRLRYFVTSVEAMLEWAKTATAGEYCVYHRGNVSVDRITDKSLASRAELARLMQARGFARAVQMRRPGTAGGSEYAVVKGDQGALPKSILMGKITATDYRILAGIKDHCDAPHGGSIQRAIRNILASENPAAIDAVFRKARQLKWIEPKAPGMNAGWNVTRTARDLLR